MKVPEGFIKECFEMLKKRMPRLSEDYLLAIAEITLSSGSWNVHTINDYSALCPIVWIQFISPSGDGKTIPIDNFLMLTLDELEKLIETDKETYKLHIANYNSESIRKAFSGNDRTGKGKKAKRIVAKYGILYKDESTIFLESAANKSYLKDLIATESKIYDGLLGRKYTTSRGWEEVPKCSKSSISATTPAIYVLMKVVAFIQGGWNRYDILLGIKVKPEDIEMLSENFSKRHSTNRNQFEGIPNYYARKLAKLALGGKMYVELDDDADLIWRKFEQEMRREAVKLDDMDLKRGYLPRASK